MLKRTWAHRGLLLTLVRRQFQVRYRQSMVGFAWAIVPPLASLAVAVIAFNRVLGVEAPRGGSYAVFTLAALTPWTFVANSIMSGIPSIIINHPMVLRLAFPRAVLPLGVIGTSLIDFALAGLGFVAFAYLTGVGIPVTALLFPVVLLILVVLVAGVCLLGSALNVFIRDIRLGIGLGMQLWLFLTPVLYPLETVPASLRPFYLANPMTGIVESFRRILVYGQGLSFELLLPSIVGALLLLLVGSWYFGATERRFADVI